MPLVSPNALLSTHLTQTPPTRPSGRTPLQANKIQLTTNSLTHTHGSALVRIGSTTVVCGVRGEILEVKDIPSFSVKDAFGGGGDAVNEDDDAERSKDRVLADYNLLVPNLSLDTGCSPLHPANAPPSAEQMSTTQRVLSLLLSSSLVRVRDLEIYEGEDGLAEALKGEEGDEMVLDDQDEQETTAKQVKAYWTLYIDIICLSHAGSSGTVFDAAWLAVLAALKTTKLPFASWDRDEGRVLCSSDVGRATMLTLRGMPVGVSFGACRLDERVLEAARRRDGEAGKKVKATKKEEAVLLIDLEGIEEECCADTGCVVVDCSRGEGATELLRVEKSGGGFVGLEEIQTLVKVAKGRWKEWTALLNGT